MANAYVNKINLYGQELEIEDSLTRTQQATLTSRFNQFEENTSKNFSDVYSAIDSEKALILSEIPVIAYNSTSQTINISKGVE